MLNNGFGFCKIWGCGGGDGGSVIVFWLCLGGGDGGKGMVKGNTKIIGNNFLIEYNRVLFRVYGFYL